MESPLLQSVHGRVLQHCRPADHLHRFDLSRGSNAKIENNGALDMSGFGNGRVDRGHLMIDVLLDRLSIDLENILCEGECCKRR